MKTPDTINGKTPEEIKKGLECCQHNEYNGLCDCDNGCPYRFKRCDQLRKDALAYIQQLEEINSALYFTLMGVMHSIDKWLDVEPYDFDADDGTVAATRAASAREATLKMIEDLQSRLAQAERERDALYFDIANMPNACDVCAHGVQDDGDCDELFGHNNGCEFKWRGVCPANTKEKNNEQSHHL